MSETFQQKENVICNFILFFVYQNSCQIAGCKDMYATRKIVEYDIAYSWISYIQHFLMS